MACVAKVRIREPAPEFHCEAVVCGSFEELSLDYYLSKGQWLVLLFIPMAFSFVCPTEVIAFADHIEEFTALGCAVAFVSTDSKHSLWTWQNSARRVGGLGKIGIPLLSDQSHRMSRDYGVLLEDDGLALRGMFIINPKGIVKQITINDLSVGRSVNEALRLVEAYQQTEEHGVVCPANWNPGDEDFEPTLEGKEAYLDRTFGDVMFESPGHSISVESQSVRSGSVPTSDANSTTPSALTSPPRTPLENGPSSKRPSVSPLSSPADMTFAERLKRASMSPLATPMGDIFRRASRRSSVVSSPLASPTQGVYGPQRTISISLPRQGYFDSIPLE